MIIFDNVYIYKIKKFLKILIFVKKQKFNIEVCIQNNGLKLTQPNEKLTLFNQKIKDCNVKEYY